MNADIIVAIGLSVLLASSGTFVLAKAAELVVDVIRGRN